MHPDIQTVRIEVELQAHFRYTARRGDFHWNQAYRLRVAPIVAGREKGP
jgi:hypothetical protein